MSAIFPINHRPGKFWATLQFPLSRLILGVLFVTVPVTLLQLLAKLVGIKSHSALGVALSLILVVVAIGGYLLFVRLIERRPVTELDRKGAAARFLLGAALGAGLFVIALMALWIIGVCSFTGILSSANVLYTLVLALLAATVEELLFRGVVFRILEETLGSWIALGLSAIVFGLLHAFNPGANATSVVAIALEAGVLLAAAYMFSRRLWFVIGLHAAWNFTEGGIFGTKVSGANMDGLIGVQFNGSDLLTGGAFGPEASIVSVVVCLMASATLLVLARRRRNIVAPIWKRRRDKLSKPAARDSSNEVAAISRS